MLNTGNVPQIKKPNPFNSPEPKLCKGCGEYKCICKEIEKANKQIYGNQNK